MSSYARLCFLLELVGRIILNMSFGLGMSGFFLRYSFFLSSSIFIELSSMRKCIRTSFEALFGETLLDLGFAVYWATL